MQAALALKAPDRAPVGWWGHTFREEWSPGDLAAVTVDRARRYGWDYVKLQPRATCFAEAFGSEYRPSGDPLAGPVLIRPAVGSMEDWERLPAVDAAVSPLADQVEALRRVAEELGPEVPVIQTVFSPLMVADFLVGGGRDLVLRELESSPELVAPALERIGEALADFAARSLQAGAAGIFYAIAGFASLDNMSAEQYGRLALPHDRRVLSSLTGSAWFNVLHLCGPRVNLDLASQLPVQAVSWSIHDEGNAGLAEGRDRAGRAAMGGINQKTTLLQGPPRAVISEARSALESTGGRGLILAPGCSVPPGAPEDNLRAMMEALPA